MSKQCLARKPGQVEHILAAIDQIVNGEVNLPPGEHPKLFQRIREVGAGYTIVGTKWTYNEKNEIATRENLIRLEDYTYKYDSDGNLLSDGRSKYEWNARGQLTKVTFPDGFGEKYTYDMFGRRMTKSQFNHQGSIQDTTVYHYKGDSWVITDEKDGAGNTVLSYTFNEEGRPLSVTYKGETFWYVYNGHGDVTALTDKNGEVAVRYEYDDWGLVSRMYNRYGERVREGIGDLESGNGSPGSLQGPEDGSGNTEPDYHPGIGNAPADGTSSTADAAVTADAFAWLDGEPLEGIQEEPSEDITTELAKVNPYRYAGYYWDRKTQMYFLQARYYDPREARFISRDSFPEEIEDPSSLNMFIYVSNNPLLYIDPTGTKQIIESSTAGIGYISVSNYPIAHQQTLLALLVELGKAREYGKNNNEYWKIRSSLGKQYYKWKVIEGDNNNNQFKYLFDLSTLTSYTPNTIGKARWATFQLLNYLEAWLTEFDQFVAQYQAIQEANARMSALLGMFIGIRGKSGSSTVKPARNNNSKNKDIVSGCNCFTAGTKILTDEGEKNIEDIEVGDKVLAKDENHPDGELAYKEVTDLFRNQRDDIIKLHVGEQIIETTNNHPFWVEGKGWVFADELQVGDKLQKADGSNLTIDKVEFVKLDEPITVYNFAVAAYHTYYVTDIGIWVHNTNTDACNWKSVKQFGHTFSTHGAGTKNTKSLTDRARSTGNNQGQWLDNQKAAEFLASKGEIKEVTIFDLPAGMGQVITPTGEIVPATRVIVVPSTTGIKTAYPIP